MFDIFIPNKYTKWYFQIIEKGRHRSLPRKDTEHHHIIPKSICPYYGNLSEHPWNGVFLTFREHYICHWLLTKMVIELHQAKATNAFFRMCRRDRQQKYTTNSSIYETTKRKMREKVSGKNSPLYGIQKSYLHKKRISESRKSFIKNGGTSWNKGIPMRESTKEKLRAARKHQVISPEQGENHSKKMTGRKKFNNGSKTIFVRLDDPILQTDNWQLGDLTPRKPNPAKIINCPYCHRDIAGAGNYSRYHGNNCKSKT